MCAFRRGIAISLVIKSSTIPVCRDAAKSFRNKRTHFYTLLSGVLYVLRNFILRQQVWISCRKQSSVWLQHTEDSLFHGRRPMPLRRFFTPRRPPARGRPRPRCPLKRGSGPLCRRPPHAPWPISSCTPFRTAPFCSFRMVSVYRSTCPIKRTFRKTPWRGNARHGAERTASARRANGWGEEWRPGLCFIADLLPPIPDVVEYVAQDQDIPAQIQPHQQDDNRG